MTDNLGGNVDLFVDNRPIKNYTRYSISQGVLQQPGTISFTIGSGDVMRDLLAWFKPLQKVRVDVEGTTVFTGELEDFSCSNRSGATELNVQGRDMLRRLVKGYVLDERAFSAPTYFDLVKQVMELAGYPKGTVPLVADNDANVLARTKIAKSFKKKGKKRRVVEVEQTNLTGVSGAKIQYERVVCQIGQTWFDFLANELKKAGLYLMAGSDGSIIITIPDAELDPIYELRRYAGVPRGPGTILYCDFANRTSSMHAHCTVYGKGRPDKNGHFPIDGQIPDVELINQGYDTTDLIVLHDTNVKDTKSCQYVAKRHLGAQRRANRTLSYTVPGHTVPSIDGRDSGVIWTPDTMVMVNDAELTWPGEIDPNAGSVDRKFVQEIHKPFYIEKVEFTRDSSGGTFSTLHLMDGFDVQFFGEDPEQGDREFDSQKVI